MIFKAGRNAKRRHERFDVQLEVRYGIGTADRIGRADNISERGLCINTNEIVRVGTLLALEVGFPGRTFLMTGEVMWAIRVPEHMEDRMVCGIGIQFTRTGPAWETFFRDWKQSRTD